MKVQILNHIKGGIFNVQSYQTTQSRSWGSAHFYRMRFPARRCFPRSDWRHTDQTGVIEPVSGSMAPLGTAEYEAIKMAIDMVNEEGGVLGKYKVEHVFADSQSNPSVGASEAERLITTEKVPILLGSYSSAIAMAISEIAERYKVPLWEMSGATDDLLIRGYQWTFRNEAMASSWGASGVEFVAEYAPEALGKELKDIKVAIVHEDGPMVLLFRMETANMRKI